MPYTMSLEKLTVVYTVYIDTGFTWGGGYWSGIWKQMYKVSEWSIININFLTAVL